MAEKFLDEQLPAWKLREGVRSCASELYDLAGSERSVSTALPLVADMMGLGEQSPPKEGAYIDNQCSLYKVERFAPAAAIFARMAEVALVGYGREAQFKSIVRSERRFITPIEDKRIVQVAADIKATFLERARELERNNQTYMPDIMMRFELMSVDESLRNDRSLSLESVFTGSELPTEFAEYTNLACHLMKAVPVLNEGTPEERRDAMHEMLPMLTGRSSLHVEILRAVRPIIDIPLHEARIEKKGNLYTVEYDARLPEEGKVIPDNLSTPLLKCPANQLLRHQTVLPVVESALLRSLHASVNLAYDRHIFGEPNRQRFL